MRCSANHTPTRLDAATQLCRPGPVERPRRARAQAVAMTASLCRNRRPNEGPHGHIELREPARPRWRSRANPRSRSHLPVFRFTDPTAWSPEAFLVAAAALAARAVWGAKTRCAPREIGDLQAGRYFWHPTRAGNDAKLLPLLGGVAERSRPERQPARGQATRPACGRPFATKRRES
jgi:hypothetical protein